MKTHSQQFNIGDEVRYKDSFMGDRPSIFGYKLKTFTIKSIQEGRCYFFKFGEVDYGASSPDRRYVWVADFCDLELVHSSYVDTGFTNGATNIMEERWLKAISIYPFKMSSYSEYVNKIEIDLQELKNKTND